MSVTAVDPWHAVADPTRRRVLARVTQGPCSVTDIARELPVSRPAVSQHLGILLGAGLVDVRRSGRMHLYQARPDGLDVLRRELETFWRQALGTFKALAEHSYQATATVAEGERG